MKGIILAGGTATRLFPLTLTTSKQLLPVYDRQMIFYPLNSLVKAGIRDILVIIAPEHSGQFLNLLGSAFKKRGIKIFFEVQKAPRGLAEALILGESFIEKENVALILGDNIFEHDFWEAVKKFKTGAQVFAKKVKDPERYGVVKFDKNKKAKFIIEKPKDWVSDYAVTGFYLYDKRAAAAAKSLNPSERGELEITDLNNIYLKKGELKVDVISGEWLDAGTFDSLLEAGNVIRQKRLYEKFHPLIDEAVIEFNCEMKEIYKKRL